MQTTLVKINTYKNFTLWYIGVASYGALGHVTPSTSYCLIFQVTSEAYKV